jgi:hypothetical protein
MLILLMLLRLEYQSEAQNLKLQTTLRHLNESLGGVLGGIDEVSDMVSKAKSQLDTYSSKMPSDNKKASRANQGGQDGTDVGQLLQEIYDLKKSQHVLNSALERAQTSLVLSTANSTSLQPKTVVKWQNADILKGVFFVCTCVCECIYVFAVSVFMHVIMHGCMDVCMYICMYVWMYV